MIRSSRQRCGVGTWEAKFTRGALFMWGYVNEERCHACLREKNGAWTRILRVISLSSSIPVDDDAQLSSLLPRLAYYHQPCLCNLTLPFPPMTYPWSFLVELLHSRIFRVKCFRVSHGYMAVRIHRGSYRPGHQAQVHRVHPLPLGEEASLTK